MSDRLRAAAQAALDALEWVYGGAPVRRDGAAAIRDLRAALAEPEAEPVAWQCSECKGFHLLCPHGRQDVPLYTVPSRQKRVNGGGG